MDAAGGEQGGAALSSCWIAEIGGGWLVWQAVREGKPWWWAAMGSVVLVAYGFIPTPQPLSDFGRLYAVYGGIFIGLSYGWGLWLMACAGYGRRPKCAGSGWDLCSTILASQHQWMTTFLCPECLFVVTDY